MLAFVDGHAKPPRSVRKQQERHGTAGSVHKKLDPLSKLSSHGGPGSDPNANAGSHFAAYWCSVYALLVSNV